MLLNQPRSPRWLRSHSVCEEAGWQRRRFDSGPRQLNILFAVLFACLLDVHIDLATRYLLLRLCDNNEF